MVAQGEPRTDRLFSVREVGGRGGRGRPGSHHVSTVASVPSRVGCGSRSEAVERCVSSYCTCVRGHRSRSDPAKVVQWKNTHVQTASEHLPRPTPLRLLGPTARAQSTGRPRPPRPPTSLTEKRRSVRGSPCATTALLAPRSAAARPEHLLRPARCAQPAAPRRHHHPGPAARRPPPPA